MTKETFTSSLSEGIFNPFKNVKGSMLDMETLTAIYQRNLELMNSTQKIAAEATKSIMELQHEYFKRTLDQWNEQIKYCCSKAPLEEKAACHAEASKEALNQTIKHAQEVNSIMVKSNEKALEAIQNRIKEGLDESVKMTKKSKEQS